MWIESFFAVALIASALAEAIDRARTRAGLSHKELAYAQGRPRWAGCGA